MDAAETPRTASHRRLAVLALGLLLALYVAHALRYDFVIDDAYISFRYARNLVEGNGLTWNPGGERVEGFSNPLWVLANALGLALGFAPEATSRALGFAAGIATLVVAWRLALALLPDSPAGRGLALVPLGLLASSRSVAAWTTGGLETRLHTLLVLLAILALDRVARGGGLVAAWAALGGLLLVRADGFVQVGLLAAGWLVWRRGRPARRDLALAGAVGATWAAITGLRWAYYGDVLPNTARAKVPGLALGPGLRYLAMAARDYGLPLSLPLALLAWRPRPARPVASLAVATALGQLAYVAAVGGDHFEYRLLDPVWPLVAVLAVAGAHRLAALARPVGRPVAAAALGVVLFWNAVPAVAGFRDTPRVVSVETEALLCGVWDRIGTWLGAHAARDEVVALRPAGVIPYRSRLTCFDMLGLNDRAVARRPPTPGEIVPGHLKTATLEDVLVRARASYVLGDPVFARHPPASPEPPEVVEVDGRRFGLFPVWVDDGEVAFRIVVVSEAAVTPGGLDPSRITTRIRPR